MIENTGPVLPPTARPRRGLRRGVGVGLSGALALAGLGLATGVASAAGTAGSAGPSQARADGTATSAVHAAAASTVRACNGGASKRTLTVGSNTQTTFTSSASLLPSPLVVTGPSKGTDTVVLTWSSETQLRGNTSNSQFDWIEGIITVDGVPVTDTGGTQLALSGSPYYASNATQACVRIGRGNHRIQLQARLVSNSGQAETGWLDDWMLRADVLD
jgi:hypothetical protein